MATGKEEKKKEDIEVIAAIYKVNLHCKECGSKIKKHLMVTQGVQSVEIEFEKGEIKVKGKIDPLKILKLIEKKSKKKVELISPIVKPKEITTTEKKPKEIKDPIIRIISAKVNMHCDKCEADLKSRLIKHKGIFDVKTDQKAQTVTVEGTIEVEKLISFLRKRVHKNAEIISVKEVKKEEKKGKLEEVKSSETTKEKDHSKSGESTKKKDVDDNKKSSGESTKEGKSGESTKKKDVDDNKKSSGESAKEGKSGESTKKKDVDDNQKSSGESAKEGKSGESTKKKDVDDNKKSSGESAKEGKSGESIKELKLGDGKSGETTKIIEIHQEHLKEEIKIKDNVPYIIHYVYAPQTFSDENPNSCSIF